MTQPMIPSLSEDGWVTTPIKMADYVLSYFFTSDYSQSYIYNNKISSLPWILQNTQGNMHNTLIDMHDTLNTYFSKYFNNVIVEVLDATDPNSTSKAAISIYLSFTGNDGVVYSLAKLLNLGDNLTIQKIITLNNG